MGPLQRRDAALHPADEGYRLLGGGHGQDDQELVPSHASHGIESPALMPEKLHDQAQQAVSSGVPQRVVDQLEPVYVNQDDAGMQRVPAAARQFGIQPRLHSAPVAV